MVACTQGRAIPLDEIKPRWLAQSAEQVRYEDASRNRSWNAGDHGDGAEGMRSSEDTVGIFLWNGWKDIGEERMVLRGGRI